MSERKIDLLGASSVVVANMIGTGVFVSLGYQLVDMHSGIPIIALWLVGGVLALCGAVCYAELATRMPEDGGEYYFLGRVYHPVVGFMAGFVSSTVGFAAPIAMAAAALGAYAKGVWTGVNPTWFGAGVILVIGLIHLVNVSTGVRFQKVFTIIKVLLIAIFVGAGLLHGNTQDYSFAMEDGVWKDILSNKFAVALVFVSYAYSGWNASAYLAGEIKHPEKNLSRSILYGAGLVTIFYVLLNIVFLMVAPAAEMTVDVNTFAPREVGIISANYIFGPTGGKLMGGIICVLLISTISAMIIAGPRVIQPMFSKLPVVNGVARATRNGNPVNAIIFQSTLALIILFSGSFEKIINYIGFTLTLFTILTVAGTVVYRMRHGKPAGYKAWGYPVTPALFIGLNIWICYYQIQEKTEASLWGLGTALLGGLLYFISTDYKQKQIVS
ncbi:MAG: amino acid permease [Bacteroidetes bacterium]|nr:amino acid permease [Bacteroidota bacterium]